jgi:invasion protein IalB
MTRICDAALAAALMMAGGLSPACSEEGGWRTTCNDAGRCTALIAVADAETGRALASVGLQVGKGGSEPVLIAFLPLGVALQPGFRAVIGSRAFDGPYEVCFPDGCRLTMPLAEADLPLWLDGETVSLRFFPHGAERPVGVDAPLTGLRAALAGVLAPGGG